jgi:hypothetical protein
MLKSLKLARTSFKAKNLTSKYLTNFKYAGFCSAQTSSTVTIINLKLDNNQRCT